MIKRMEDDYIDGWRDTVCLSDQMKGWIVAQMY